MLISCSLKFPLMDRWREESNIINAMVKDGVCLGGKPSRWLQWTSCFVILETNNYFPHLWIVLIVYSLNTWFANYELFIFILMINTCAWFANFYLVCKYFLFLQLRFSPQLSHCISTTMIHWRLHASLMLNTQILGSIRHLF